MADDASAIARVGGDASKPTCSRQSTDLAVVMQSLRAMTQDRDALYIADEIGLVRIDKQTDESTESLLPFIPRAITADGDFLYLQESWYEDGWRSSIYRMPKGGPVPDRMLWRNGLRVSQLTASGGDVFFIEDGALRRVNAATPASSDLLEEQVTSFSVDDDSVFARSGDAVVWRSRTTGERQVLASGLSGDLLGAAGGHVYLWDKVQSSIVRLPKQGGDVALVAQVDSLPDGARANFAVDERGIYFANQGSALYWVDLRGEQPGGPTRVAQGASYDDDDFDTVVLEDEGYVYWVVGGPPGNERYAQGGVVIVKRCRSE